MNIITRWYIRLKHMQLLYIIYFIILLIPKETLPSFNLIFCFGFFFFYSSFYLSHLVCKHYFLLFNWFRYSILRHYVPNCVYNVSVCDNYWTKKKCVFCVRLASFSSIFLYFCTKFSLFSISLIYCFSFHGTHI